LEIFAEKVASQDPQERILALRLLDALDPFLAEKLATAVLEGEPVEPEVRRVADEVAMKANALVRSLPRIFIHIRSNGDRERAQAVAERLRESEYVVLGIEWLKDTGPGNSQLRFFRMGDEEEAWKIHETLREMGIELDPIFTPGFEESDEIRPGHFEIWFARGEPKELIG
jgi:hypothetical protein